MKTLRFINKDRSSFASVLRKNVHDHFKAHGISTQGNWTVHVKLIVMLGMLLVPFVLLLALPVGGWLIFPFAVLMGIGMSGLGMSVMHDGAHGSVSKKAWVNKMMSYTIYLLGSNLFTWKVQHNVLHHTFTNIDGYDEDISPRGVIRLSKGTPLKKMHRFQYLYAPLFYGLMTLAKIVNDFRQMRRYNKNGITRQQNAKPAWEFTKMLGLKAVYFFAVIGLPLMLTSLALWQVMLVFLIMHFTAGLLMSSIFQMAHIVEGAEQHLPAHDGNMENEWAIHQLQTTANFSRNNHFLSWFAGGLNFQIEHHLFPHICHIHYRGISPIVERTAAEFGLVYNLKPSFRSALLSHLRTLKRLGRR